MTEREKVKAGLECLTHVNFAIYKTECQERNCPYEARIKKLECELSERKMSQTEEKG